MAALRLVLICVFTLITVNTLQTNALIDEETLKLIQQANKNTSYLGLVVPSYFELSPLLENPSYHPDDLVIDYAGKRFRFATIKKQKVILVISGSGMTNAAITTQLLLSLFDVTGVVHFGVSGNVNPYHNIGDVAIPKKWAHVGHWVWQRHGDGPEADLPFNYTKEYGHLNFAEYTETSTGNCESPDNLLNNIWYEPEEVYPVDGTPEEEQSVFWVPVSSTYQKIASGLKVKLLNCTDGGTTCVDTPPKIQSLRFGISSGVFLDNAAYRDFLFKKFKAGPVDMEGAAVALVCLQQKVPFVTFKGLSNYAGAGSDASQAETYGTLAARNVCRVVKEFIEALVKAQKKTTGSPLFSIMDESF